MVLTESDSSKALSLSKAFKAFSRGERNVGTQHEAKILFEAARLQPSSAECLEQIISSQHLLAAVRQSVRVSDDEAFTCQHVLPFLNSFSDPESKALNGGDLLRRLVSIIVCPPTAWTHMAEAYKKGVMDRDGIKAFAWLCLQVVTHPEPGVSELVERITGLLEDKPLLDLQWPEIRQLAYQIQKALSIGEAARQATDAAVAQLGGPGGRHDNDFADFRDISIYPTPDEFESKTKPFLRTAHEVAKTEPKLRPAYHLDNHFRLYREDFLSEVRENLEAIFGNKQSRHRAQALTKLKFVNISIGQGRRTHQCHVLLSANAGLSFPGKANKDESSRRKYLNDNSRILGHQSLGCLCKDGSIIAFAFIVRDLDHLVKQPPVLTLRFALSKDLTHAVQALHTGSDIRFITVDCAWFAYAPVLPA